MIIDVEDTLKDRKNLGKEIDESMVKFCNLMDEMYKLILANRKETVNMVELLVDEKIAYSGIARLLALCDGDSFALRHFYENLDRITKILKESLIKSEEFCEHSFKVCGVDWKGVREKVEHSLDENKVSH